MKFFAQIDGQKRLIPLWNADYEAVKRLKRDTVYQFEAVRRRNPKFHAMAFALLNIGFENQELIKSFDHYRKITVMRAGFYDTIETDKGTVYLPQSISFSSMDEDTFEDCYNKILDVIAEQLSNSPNEIRKQVESFM